MSSLLIKSDNKKHITLLKELAEQLGEEVKQLTPAENEDFHLGFLMKKEKTGKIISRKSIFNLLEKE